MKKSRAQILVRSDLINNNKMDALQQRIDTLEAELEVRVQNSDAKVAELDARYWVLPAGEERTAIAKKTAEISIEILELRQDISAMKAEVRRLREAERRGILCITFQMCIFIYHVTNITTCIFLSIYRQISGIRHLSLLCFRPFCRCRRSPLNLTR